jgi:hypothetical protein
MEEARNEVVTTNGTCMYLFSHVVRVPTGDRNFAL